jgi:splicing factor 3A subunit 3
MLAYLIDFRQRSTPFANVEAGMKTVNADFDAAWTAGTFPGWVADEAAEAAAAGADAPPEELDLSGVGSAAELHPHGLERLKSALVALGLKSGGTLEQRAERLFSTNGVPRAQWPKKILAATDKKKKKASKPAGDTRREMASLEARVYHMASVLAETRVRSTPHRT